MFFERVWEVFFVKKCAILLSLMMLLVLSACAGAEEFVRIGTSSVGGGFYQIGNVIAQLGAKVMPEVNFTAVTGGSIKNCINLDKKEVELGIVQSGTLLEAVQGVGSFEGKPITSLRYITAIYPMPCHILVNLDAGITSVADMRGKRIDFGPVGGGIEVNTAQILDIFGITPKDVKVERFGRSEVAEAMKTGTSDAHIWATNAPNAEVTDMITSGKVGLIGIEPEKINEIVQKYPSFAADIIPAKSYAGQDGDLFTVAAVGALVAGADMSDELAYKITKMLYENEAFLKERHKYFANFSLQKALDGRCIPIHPGAEKFYREKGLLK